MHDGNDACSLTYTWLSDGTPVSATLGEGNLPGRLYNGSFVFATDSTRIDIAESVAWDEGRIFFLDTDTTDCWYAGDHLGNVRSVIDISRGQAVPQVLEQSDYLPYGTRINNTAFASMSGENRWRYAGKEEQRLRFFVTDSFAPDGGYNRSLDLGLLNFGARMYDPFTARWTSIDKKAQTRLFSSPMTYGSDNPINRIDMDGNTDWGLVKKGVGTTLTGAGSLGAGIALTGLSSGAAVAIGGIFVVDGYSAVGIGIAMLTAGFLTPDEKVDPSLAERIPTDFTNALSKSADMIAGNENNEIETVTSIVTTAVGGSTFTLNPQSIGELISDLGTVVQIGNTSQQVNNLIKVTQAGTLKTASSSETERSLYNEEWQEYLWTPNY